MVGADGPEFFLENWFLRLAKTHSKSSLYFEIRSGVKAFETQKIWKFSVWKIFYKTVSLNKLFEILEYSLSCWHKFISNSFKIKLVCYVFMNIQNRQWFKTTAFHYWRAPMKSSRFNSMTILRWRAVENDLSGVQDVAGFTNKSVIVWTMLGINSRSSFRHPFTFW